MPRNRDAYHHGNLREALLDAGLELTRTGGPAALVIRDVTRRIGVSPNAAYRHFTDRDDLLRAVAERIQQQMAARMAEPGLERSADRTTAGQSGAEQARAELRAVGLGYIDFALSEPGWFEVAFGGAVFADAVMGHRAGTGSGPLPAPMVRLIAALDRLAETGVLDPGRRVGAEWPCWSAVHGFSVLALHGPLRGQPPAVLRAAADRTVDAVITGLCAATATPG